KRGIRRERSGNSESRARDARYDAPTGVRPAVHVARAVLHVAVFPGRGRAERVRRAGSELAALPAGRRMGRGVFWRVLGRLLRVLVLPAVARTGARADARPRVLPARGRGRAPVRDGNPRTEA